MGYADPKDPERSLDRYCRFAIAGGIVLSMLGIVVLAGWFVGSNHIISVVPGFPAMAFNTALAFLLSGTAIIASTRAEKRYRGLAVLLSSLVVVIAVVRLMEIIILGQSFHFVDRLFSAYLVDQAFREGVGGGMGPNTALIFTLGNLSLIASLVMPRRMGQVGQELTSYVIITLGMIALAGYVTDAERGYRWGSFAAMALHTATGVIIFGSSLLARAWWMLPSNRAQIPLWIPATVCFTGLLVDLYTPLGVANGILYVPLVLTALWFGNRYAPFSFALVCTLLILLGFFAVNHEGAGYWRDLVNRSITTATLWLVASLVFYFMRNSRFLETERIRFSALVRTAPDAVITMDANGIILSFNPAAEAMFGYGSQDTVGRNVKMLMPEPYHSEHDGYLARYKKTGEARIIGTARVVSGRRKNGIVFPLDLSVSTVQSGGQQTFVGIVRDISERVRQEEALRSTLARMEAYAADLERSNQDLDEFAYIASHDLKEPLRGLHNHSRFLMEDYDDRLDDNGKRRLRRLVHLSQRMEKLVNDLLYFSRIGRQQLAIKQTDMNLVVKDVVRTMEHFLEDRRAKVSIDGTLPTMTCDSIRITEVFRNLITNAVKYNDKAEPVVRVGFLERCEGEDGAVLRDVFYVRDNGKGIPRQFYEDIFRIFKRLEKSQEKDDGTGAGLTFVRKIIARHQGKIWLESEMGIGTTFYFTLGSRQEGRYAAA